METMGLHCCCALFMTSLSVLLLAHMWIVSLRCHALVFDLTNSICTLLAECRVWIMEFHKSCVGVEQGFLPDFPYRENSCPWFGYRKVVKGGCDHPLLLPVA